MLAGNNTLYKDFSMSETILPEVFASPMPVAAPGLLDEIMAQTRFKPESESYDIAFFRSIFATRTQQELSSFPGQ